MNADIRPARASDIDALLQIENSVFSTDRISRRSFRQHIDSDSASLLVADNRGQVLGYCLVLYRAGSGVARLYSIAVANNAGMKGLGQALLAAAERDAYGHERLVLRLEVREDNARAIDLYERAGFRRFRRDEQYYEDGSPALRFEKLLRGEPISTQPVPYYEQREEFTCGPCCLMMAMARFKQDFKPDPVFEIRLWREATTVFMLSGPGGCEPFGLAVAAAEHGLSASVYVSRNGPLFLESVRAPEKQRVMRLAQKDFLKRAQALGIETHRRAFSLNDITNALGSNKVVAVLISGYLMFGKKVPHWVLAIGHDAEHIVVHDPWVEDERGETASDAAAIPIPNEIFMRMARFGQNNLRAAVVLGDADAK